MIFNNNGVLECMSTRYSVNGILSFLEHKMCYERHFKNGLRIKGSSYTQGIRIITPPAVGEAES